MKRRPIDMQWLIISLIGSVLINLIMLPMFAVTADNVAPADSLPPRGTPEPTPEPTAPPAPEEAEKSTAAQGGRIQLHVTYGENWSWDDSSWQELWTQVEWTDGKSWFPVDGWRGTLDGISEKEEGDWLSWKEWWVSPKDLNTGPFRWIIYDGEGGKALATSLPFNLPAHSHATMVVDLSVGE